MRLIIAIEFRKRARRLRTNWNFQFGTHRVLVKLSLLPQESSRTVEDPLFRNRPLYLSFQFLMFSIYFKIIKLKVNKTHKCVASSHPVRTHDTRPSIACLQTISVWFIEHSLHSAYCPGIGPKRWLLKCPRLLASRWLCLNCSNISSLELPDQFTELLRMCPVPLF